MVPQMSKSQQKKHGFWVVFNINGMIYIPGRAIVLPFFWYV